MRVAVLRLTIVSRVRTTLPIPVDPSLKTLPIQVTLHGLHLNFETDNPIDYGVCRSPVAAGSGIGGFEFDIVPGNPDESIMVFRDGSEDPGIKMPETGIFHDPIGVEVLTEWIAAMEPRNCHGDDDEDEGEREPSDSDSAPDDSAGGGFE